MKHHYIVYAMMKYNALCRFGTICSENELHAVLSRKRIIGYKLISIDDAPMDGWEAREWIYI